MLSGAVFAIAYSVSGLFAGQLSDRANRKVVLSAACILWSLTTLIQGTTNNFTVFFAMRLFLGVFQSVGNPTSLTILADYFPPERRSTVNSIWNSGIYIGSAISSFAIISISKIGWRSTYNVFGLIGVLIGALTLLVVKEPKRENFDSKEEISNQSNLSSFKESLVDIMREPVSRYVTIAGMFNYVGGFACMYYMPAFF